MASTRLERLYGEVEHRSMKQRMGKPMTAGERARREESMAAEGGFINDRSGEATKKVRRRLRD